MWSLPIYVYDVPVASINCPDTICNNDTLVIASTSSITNSIPNLNQYIDTYEWKILDQNGTSILTYSNNDTLVTSLSTGTYTIKLLVGSNSPFGCYDSTTCSITVQSPPLADFSIGPDSSCLGNGPTLFQDNSNNSSGGQINYWEWNFGSVNSPPFA